MRVTAWTLAAALVLALGAVDASGQSGGVGVAGAGGAGPGDIGAAGMIGSPYSGIGSGTSTQGAPHMTPENLISANPQGAVGFPALPRIAAYPAVVGPAYPTFLPASDYEAKVGTTQGTLGGDDQWRFRFHNGHWWYWLASNQWLVDSNGAWMQYQPGMLSNGSSYVTGSYYSASAAGQPYIAAYGAYLPVYYASGYWTRPVASGGCCGAYR